MTTLTLARLEHFIAVAEARSLNQAARQLGLSQPALTKSIRKLETELGVKLFDRGGVLELTPTGRALLQRARSLVSQASDLEHEITQIRSLQRGELKIGAGPLIAESFIGPAVASFLAANPGVRIEVQLGPYNAFAPQLRDRRLDFFAADITEIEIDPDLAVRPFPRHEIVWFCRAGHPLAGRIKVPPAEFFSYPLALPSLPGWAQSWFRDHAPGCVGAFRPAFESNHYPALKAAVQNGNLISGSIAPALAEDLRTGRVAAIDLDAPGLRASAGLVTMKNRSLPPAAAAFIAELERHIELAERRTGLLELHPLPGDTPLAANDPRKTRRSRRAS